MIHTRRENTIEDRKTWMEQGREAITDMQERGDEINGKVALLAKTTFLFLVL